MMTALLGPNVVVCFKGGIVLQYISSSDGHRSHLIENRNHLGYDAVLICNFVTDVSKELPASIFSVV
jgi:hypothetical protein